MQLPRNQCDSLVTWLTLAIVLRYYNNPISISCEAYVHPNKAALHARSTSFSKNYHHQNQFHRATTTVERIFNPLKTQQLQNKRSRARFSQVAKSTTSDVIMDITEEEEDNTVALPSPPSVSFSHVHLYVDALESVQKYKDLEGKINQFHDNKKDATVLFAPQNDGEFVAQNRDVVKQLICGLNFRVTGRSDDWSSEREGTDSVLVTTVDPKGVQIVVTAKSSESPGSNSNSRVRYPHFSAQALDRFYAAHAGRQGVAVLAFEVSERGGVDALYERYAKLHPKLLLDEQVQVYDNAKVLEVYAYYKGEKILSERDDGTLLRFVETLGPSAPIHALPGLVHVDAAFSSNAQAAYCDHWVSNVVSRTGFIDTLEDVLGFTPKVDFNAGVVAAGEAQIESTVTGNSSPFSTNLKDAALKDQSQVYLPINNALSPVGHVHGFIEEIGQGIQHIASRVDDLITFVQNANDNRKLTGEGFTFLGIPRSYYGILTVEQISYDVIDGIKSTSPTVSKGCAETVVSACESSGITDAEGAVDLGLTAVDVSSKLNASMANSPSSECQEEYEQHRDIILQRILLSRYSNLYKLLRDNLTEESYLGIVRNCILIDVQGGDLLFQIFTSNILQRVPGEESPFFEYIQRVCSTSSLDDSCKAILKPGCGGFGIRNFLTLFLSIEVSKAMREVIRAKKDGDTATQEMAQKMVDLFTDQLNEANPILTDISDAMTAEGNAREQLALAIEKCDESLVAKLQEKIDSAVTSKIAGNEKLLSCSSKYMCLMRDLRERRH